jgi:hypothetical protein
MNDKTGFHRVTIDPSITLATAASLSVIVSGFSTQHSFGTIRHEAKLRLFGFNSTWRHPQFLPHVVLILRVLLHYS